MVKGKIVLKANGDVKREVGYFYFLDKKLNVRRVKRNNKNGNKNKKDNKKDK